MEIAFRVLGNVSLIYIVPIFMTNPGLIKTRWLRDEKGVFVVFISILSDANNSSILQLDSAGIRHTVLIDYTVDQSRG